MDYEKKYKDALRQAEGIIKYYKERNRDEAAIEDLQDIFPELKESEDEKIKQKIIKLIKMSSEVGGFALHKWEAEEMLAWLEKQEQKPSSQSEFKVGDFVKDTNHHKQPIYKIVSIDKECYICESDDVTLGDKAVMHFAFDNPYLRLVEQKPTDKVEPKFYKGEWLCENEPNNYARFIQILEIVNVQGKERYRISRDIHNDKDVVEFDFVEKYYHKFDIKDAKDGDVLSNGKMIVILKHFEEPSYRQHIVAYIGLDTNGNIQITDDTWNLGVDKTHPATKEQRDQLKKAMADAGWEFDFDKKELKKIHVIDEGKAEMDYCFTKMMNGEKVSPTWDYEDEANLNNIIWLCNNCINGSETTWIPSQATKIKHLIETIKKRGLSQQKHAWSEEDENNLTDTCVAIRKFYHRNNGAQDLIDWLQSLKNRIVPQPKDWSEDDDKRFNEILSVIDNAGVLTESEYSFLCNIRPQN